jgi:hypothetical protein
MKCLRYAKCGRRTGNTKKRCWKNWQLCGECAVMEHPEGYDYVYVKKIISKMKAKGRYYEEIGKVL